MSQLAVSIIEPSQIVAAIIRKSLENTPYRCIVMREMANLHTQENIGLVLLDVMATMPDATGLERPIWKILMEQPPLPMPVLCFTGSNSTPSDTPLFTAPAETMTIAAPGDFTAVMRIIQTYLTLFERQPLLREGLAGTLRPSLRGSLREFSVENLLKMVSAGSYTGVLVLQDGIHTGIIACEKGEVIHAMVGALARKEAIFSVFKWHIGSFAFFRSLQLGERTISHGVENLILEANRLDDEVTELAGRLPLSAYVQRVRGYVDLLPGKEFTMHEVEVLAVIDQHHIVRDLISRFPREGEIVVMKALRALLEKQLIEVAPLGDPRYLIPEQVG